MTRLYAKHWWLIFTFCLIGFGLGLWRMTLRIAEFNLLHAFHNYHAEPVVARKFRLEGWPGGKLHDELDDQGRSFLRLEYADQQILIPVKRPPTAGLSVDEFKTDLGIYDEWVKLLAFNEVRRVPAKSGAPTDMPYDLEVVPGSERLWIVTRTTPPGYDEDTWGSVRKNEWVFTFYDLRPDGTVNIFKRRWPRSYTAERFLKAKSDSTDPKDHRYRELAAIQPLAERSPEYFAAMFVIPKLNVPNYKFEDTAFSFKVLSWTGPVTGFSALGLAFSLAFALGAGVEKRSVRQVLTRAAS